MVSKVVLVAFSSFAIAAMGARKNRLNHTNLIASGGPSCANIGCGTYRPGAACQCNRQCTQYNSCCNDYSALCAGGGGAPARPTNHSRPGPKASSLKGVFGHPSASIDYPKYEGFTLMLAEEFDEPIDLDYDPIWTWSDGGLREGSVRFRKEAIEFKDGKMKIQVSKRALPPLDSCSHAAVETIPNKPLVSGELRSRYNMFRYGRYEVRMKAPEVKHGQPGVNGNFIATMFVYRDANAHHWREIDFEITGDAPNSLVTNLLYADGTKNWLPHLQDDRRANLGNVNLRKDFHTYAFEWTPKGVIWFVDGKEIRRGSKLKVPEKSTKIMMNLWIFTGGNFGGRQIQNNEYPLHSEYEYFRFYKWDGDNQYPCADMVNSCLSEDDMYLTSNNPCDGISQQGLLEGERVCTAKCTGAAAPRPTTTTTTTSTTTTSTTTTTTIATTTMIPTPAPTNTPTPAPTPTPTPAPTLLPTTSTTSTTTSSSAGTVRTASWLIVVLMAFIQFTQVATVV